MSVLSLAEPLSPELVLVSSPQEASMARALLPDRPAPAQQSRRRAGSAGAAAFSAFCVANSLIPFAFALLTAN